MQTSAKQVSSPQISSYGSGLHPTQILPLIWIPAYVSGSSWLCGSASVKGLLVEVADYRLWFQLNNLGRSERSGLLLVEFKDKQFISYSISQPCHEQWTLTLIFKRSMVRAQIFSDNFIQICCPSHNLFCRGKEKKKTANGGSTYIKKKKPDHCARDFLSQNQ